MADTIKVLGQLLPAGTTLSTLYTASGVTAVASSVVVCNQSGTAGSFRISVRVAAEADSAKQYLYYDCPIPGNDTFVATIGMTLADSDVVSVYSSNGNMSFNLLGIEVV